MNFLWQIWHSGKTWLSRASAATGGKTVSSSLTGSGLGGSGTVRSLRENCKCKNVSSGWALGFGEGLWTFWTGIAKGSCGSDFAAGVVPWTQTRCRFRCSFREKFLPQMLQGKGRSPVCRSMWRVRWLRSLNFWWHSEHWWTVVPGGGSMLWIRSRCRLILLPSTKSLLQMWQTVREEAWKCWFWWSERSGS